MIAPTQTTLPPLDDYADWMLWTDRAETAQAQFVGALLYDTLHPTSVVDWGCASGLYLVPFRERGCTVFGLDGENEAGKQLPRANFWRRDLRQWVYLPLWFDLALCIEVAEHLQPKYADTLVENVARSADMVFWSAAVPGQHGLCHYNEQPWEYWYAKWKAQGFDLHPLNDAVRAAIAEHPDCLRWLKNNARLLVRGGEHEQTYQDV